jgi:hypothetical protein
MRHEILTGETDLSVSATKSMARMVWRCSMHSQHASQRFPSFISSNIKSSSPMADCTRDVPPSRRSVRLIDSMRCRRRAASWSLACGLIPNSETAAQNRLEVLDCYSVRSAHSELDGEQSHCNICSRSHAPILSYTTLSLQGLTSLMHSSKKIIRSTSSYGVMNACRRDLK